MNSKDFYNKELQYLDNAIGRCKQRINKEGVTTSTGFGAERKEKVSQAVEAYTKLIDAYIKIDKALEDKQ